MSNIKDICCNPRLRESHDLVLAGCPGHHVAQRRRRWVHAPVIHAASHVDHKKELHGFLFLCIHVVLFLQLWCSAGAPLKTSRNVVYRGLYSYRLVRVIHYSFPKHFFAYCFCMLSEFAKVF